MANVPVTIKIANRRIVADPDPAYVNPGDTVVWQLAQGLRWPPLAAEAITFLGGTNLIPSVSFVDGTVQGTVILTATLGQDESYNVTVNSTSEYGDELISSHQSDSTFDPKIIIKASEP